MINKGKLKEWALLKTKKDYDFFYRITKMLSAQKIEEIGIVFLQDIEVLTGIVKDGKTQDAKIYIDSLKGRERKIVAADTYFTMFYEYQIKNFRLPKKKF